MEPADSMGFSDPVNALAVAEDIGLLVSAGDDCQIRLWNVGQADDNSNGSYSLVGVMKGHTDFVSSVQITADRRHVVSCSGDQTIRIWSLRLQKEVLKFDAHTDEVASVEIAPDAPTQLASTSKDGTVRFWNCDFDALE